MKIQIFDNGGETADRYTLCLWFDQEKCDVYLMSDNANSPNGICIYSGEFSSSRWNELLSHKKQISFLDLPKGVLAKIVDILAREVDMLLDHER